MPSLLYVIRRLQVTLFGLLIVFYALEAEVAAIRRVQAALEATIPVSNNGTSISSSDEITIEGCKDRCGSVIIPYPFGMDTSNCYRDARFKITCNYFNNPPVAKLDSLSSIDRHEVLEITVDHYVRINMLAPVTCGTNTSSMVYDLPFPVSSTRNKLTVLGCSLYGTIASKIYPTDRLGEQMSSKLTRKGCESHCVNGHTNIPPSHCSGYGCCKTKIPEGLTSYTIETNSVRVDANEFTYPCASAFLVDHEYYKVEDLLLSRNDSFVPVILDWAIADSATCIEAKRNLSSYACGRNTYCLASQNVPGYHCKCSKGFEGNPYLARGCQDVDECKEPHKCGKGVMCINTQGSYNCSCPPDKKLEINGEKNSCTPDEQRLPADQENKRRLHIIVIATSGIGISVIIILLLGIGYCFSMSDKKELLPPARSTTSTPEDFGDGGAFPEIHVAQYPLGMGRKGGQENLGSKLIPVTVDAHGNVAFDAIVRQHENASTIVYSSHRNLVPKVLKAGGGEPDQSDEELQKEIEETTQSTKAALEKIVNVRLSAAQPKKRLVSPPEVDPLEPPKLNHKKVRKAPGSPPPPRPINLKDYPDCKIPPCIWNSENPKGYTIPRDSRLATDSRGLQEIKIRDNFAKLAESLYVAEEKARASVAMRRKVEKEMLLREKERKEQKARSERAAGGAPPPPSPSSVCMTTSDGIVSDGGDQDMRGDYEKVKEKDSELPRESKEEREY
ncbi:hypothetical protein MKW98_020294 [Papaver atlanticum]|uniref:EGF-like domain-containing protein n=1 Tax=Papaver atlanticum TaxID=357466 RepID=A0AAD4TE02_9MAGN|nr:hypothetical protein MKW98_020294 [Papaver atlanticum]